MRTPLIVAALLAVGWAVPVGATVTAYTVYRAPVSPQMDGEVLGDPAWQAIPEATGFHVLGGGYTAAKQTAVRICWDAEAIYVAFVAEEPDAALLKPMAGDGGATWQEDSMEVFLQPRPPTGQVYQLGVSAGAAKAGGEGYPEVTKFQAAARIGPASYSLELRVPWEVVGTRAQAGASWRGTVCRDIFTTASGGDKFTTLSPLRTQFLEPANFAALRFSDQTLDVAAAGRLSEELNREYRRTLETELRKLAGEGRNYVGTLRGAADDEAYGKDARELQSQWQRVAALSAGATRASLSDLRGCLASSRTLVQRSFEVKYRVLLRQLVLD
jgi:hypothetical protein